MIIFNSQIGFVLEFVGQEKILEAGPCSIKAYALPELWL